MILFIKKISDVLVWDNKNITEHVTEVTEKLAQPISQDLIKHHFLFHFIFVLEKLHGWADKFSVHYWKYFSYFTDIGLHSFSLQWGKDLSVLNFWILSD